MNGEVTVVVVGLVVVGIAVVELAAEIDLLFDLVRIILKKLACHHSIPVVQKLLADCLLALGCQELQW